MEKIDCHCHIVNEKIKKEYYAQTDGYAIVMELLDKFKIEGLENDIYRTVSGDKRLFLCPCVDICKEIPSQLKRVEKILGNYQIVGLKIYLTYQTGRADDEKMMSIYEFAAENRLTVTYHCGSCGLRLPTENDMEGSNAKYIGKVAERFPTVNFVVAHMDDPRYNECIGIVNEHANMYTDFSGAYEPGTPEGENIHWAIDTFSKAIHQFPDTYKKILYGTDFCPPINLSAIKEYEYTISEIFSVEQYESIYYKNCLKAFPRISDYIKGE